MAIAKRGRDKNAPDAIWQPCPEFGKTFSCRKTPSVKLMFVGSDENSIEKAEMVNMWQVSEDTMGVRGIRGAEGYAREPR